MIDPDPQEARTFTYAELAACAAREVALRKNVFRRRGMTDMHKREIAMMVAIHEHLFELAKRRA